MFSLWVMQLECPVSLSGDHISWPLFQGKKNSIQVLPLRRHDDIKHFQRRAITSSKGDTGLYPQRRKPWAPSTWGHPHVSQTFVSSGRGRNITMVTQWPDCSKDRWFPTEESSFAILQWEPGWALSECCTSARPLFMLWFPFLPNQQILKQYIWCEQNIPTDRVHLIQALLGLPYPL